MDSSVISNVSEERSLRRLAFEKKFTYWARRALHMIDVDTVVFSAFEDDLFHRLDLDSIIQHLKDIKLFKAVKSVCLLPNPDFAFIRFSDSSYVDQFKNLTNFIMQKRIRFVTGQEKITHCKIFIKNFPPEFVISELPKLLENYGKVLKIAPSVIQNGSDSVCQIGQCMVEFLLSDARSLDELPTFVHIMGFRVFLSIPGKKKVCFRCQDSAHLISSCPFRFCKICRSLKALGHFCKLSYAAKVVGPSDVSRELDERLMEDENLSDFNFVDFPSADQVFSNPLLVDVDSTDCASPAVLASSLVEVSTAAPESLVDDQVNTLLPNSTLLDSIVVNNSNVCFASDINVDRIVPVSLNSNESLVTGVVVASPDSRLQSGTMQKRKNVSDKVIAPLGKISDGPLRKQHFLRSGSAKSKKIKSFEAMEESSLETVFDNATVIKNDGSMSDP